MCDQMITTAHYHINQGWNLAGALTFANQQDRVLYWNTHFRVSWRPLVEESIPYIGLWWNNFSKKGGSFFFPRLFKRTVLDQPTVDCGGVSTERSLAVAVGCLHFNSTSTALPRHFQGTSTVKKTKKFCGFYPHRSRDSVSPVCGIFNRVLIFLGCQSFLLALLISSAH